MHRLCWAVRSSFVLCPHDFCIECGGTPGGLIVEESFRLDRFVKRRDAEYNAGIIVQDRLPIFGNAAAIVQNALKERTYRQRERDGRPKSAHLPFLVVIDWCVAFKWYPKPRLGSYGPNHEKLSNADWIGCDCPTVVT